MSIVLKLRPHSTLRDQIVTVEASILEAMEGKHLRSSSVVCDADITAFTGLHVELAKLFWGHRRHFLF